MIHYIIILSIIIVLFVLFFPFKHIFSQHGGADALASDAQQTPPTPQTQPPQAPALAQQQLTDPSLNADNTRNTTILMVSRAFQNGGFIKTWKFVAYRPGIVHLQVYRGKSLVGENIYQITSIGDNIVTIDPAKQISFKKGDIIGLKFPDLGNVAYKEGLENILIAEGSLDYIASQRIYQISTAIIQRNEINHLLVGGSAKNSAKNVDAIIKAYQQIHTVPPDAPYWIKTKLMKKPAKIFCNFSYRKGRGYMLVGSVAPSGEWLKVTGAYPFDPRFSYGDYDVNGRNSTYYRKWDELDYNTVVDNDPQSCSDGGLLYNNDGKYCSTSDKKRLNLIGGINEIMFATGNGKFWTVLNRRDIDEPLGKVEQKIVPIATSANFEGSCDQNKSVYKKADAGSIWLNMGNSYACDTDNMFWGQDGHTKWMAQNDGIQIFIGSSVMQGMSSVMQGMQGSDKKYPHNPSVHRAPGKGKNKSSYNEAQAVCRSLGKKLCSMPQLSEAQKHGYGVCSCGWTDTKNEDKENILGFPTNIDTWASVQANKETSQNCGKIGINTCKSVLVDETTWNNDIADIYCCDKFVYSQDFANLDKAYRMSRVWIAKAEQVFEELYNTAIPSKTSFIAVDTDGSGIGLSVKKIDEHNYSLDPYDKGTGSGNAQIVKGVVNIENGTNAIFMKDIPEFNIKAGVAWPVSTGNTSIVRYGSVLKLQNVNTTQLLIGSNDKYWHAGSSKQQMVFGNTSEAEAESEWIIKAERGLGKVDANGYGDEKAKFGAPIVKGSIIRLENKTTGYNLSSAPIFISPVSDNFEVHLHEQGARGDSNNYWRIETGKTQFWYIDTPVSIVHVNTGRVLTVAGKFLTRQAGGVQVSAIEIDTNRGNNDIWIAKDPVVAPYKADKCQKLINKIIEAREYINAGSPDSARLIKKYRNQYDKECYNVSVASFNNILNPIVAKIDRENKLLNQEQSNYLKLKQEYTNTTNLQLSKNKFKDERNAELQKLLSKCTPVKHCIKAIENNGDVSKQCAKLLPLIDGKITPELRTYIKTLIKDGYSVNNFDIKTHKDFLRLLKLSQIKSCY